MISILFIKRTKRGWDISKLKYFFRSIVEVLADMDFVVSMGITVTIALSPLVWVHYYVLVLILIRYVRFRTNETPSSNPSIKSEIETPEYSKCIKLPIRMPNDNEIIPTARSVFSFFIIIITTLYNLFLSLNILCFLLVIFSFFSGLMVL